MTMLRIGIFSIPFVRSGIFLLSLTPTATAQLVDQAEQYHGASDR